MMFWTQQIGLIAVLIEHGKWWRSVGRKGTRANLSGADLSGADLGGAYLSGADLSDADLSGANLGGANLGGAGIPVVPGLHTRTLAAIDAGGVLDMSNWHYCETTQLSW